MELILQRGVPSDQSTLGELSIDGMHVCYTLEDIIREVKVFGRTAIPAGRYRIFISFSAHFNKLLPLLMDVENFSGVRIHAGNSPEDTDGCILVGLAKAENRVLQSQLAMAILYPRIQAALQDGGECWITIRNPEIQLND